MLAHRHNVIRSTHFDGKFSYIDSAQAMWIVAGGDCVVCVYSDDLANKIYELRRTRMSGGLCQNCMHKNAELEQTVFLSLGPKLVSGCRCSE